MKKILLCIFLFWNLNQLSSQTNVYHPFPDTNAVWSGYYNALYSGCCGFSMHYYDRYYYQSGDTLINSTHYNKVYLFEHMIESWSDMSCSCYNNWGYSSSFAGGLRNDSAAKKVYFFSSVHNTEYLLYDFSVGVGDTINYWQPSGGIYAITSIDSDLVNGIYHKRFNVTDLNQGWSNSISIIEGVGSTTGLLEPWSFFEDTGGLLCFSVNGTNEYPASPTSCSVITSVPDLKKETISVFPNPSNGNFFVKTSENGNLEIFNIIGEKVLQAKINSHQTEINNKDLPAGIYFLNLKTSTGIYSEKIIIE